MDDVRPEPQELGAQPYRCPHSDEGRCTECRPAFFVEHNGQTWMFPNHVDCVRWKAAEDTPWIARILRARADRRAAAK